MLHVVAGMSCENKTIYFCLSSSSCLPSAFSSTSSSFSIQCYADCNKWNGYSSIYKALYTSGAWKGSLQVFFPQVLPICWWLQTRSLLTFPTKIMKYHKLLRSVPWEGAGTFEMLHCICICETKVVQILTKLISVWRVSK